MNRFVVAAAVGAGVFALAGAGAAALDTGGDANGQVVQQTNALSATCASKAVNFSNDVTGADLTSLHIPQQSVESAGNSNSCDGDWVQGVAQLTNGSLAYTNKVWIPTSNISSTSSDWFLGNNVGNASSYGDAPYGIDLYPQFTPGVCAQDVVSTVLTIAGEIDGPGNYTTGAIVSSTGGKGTLPSCADTADFPVSASVFG